MSRGSNDKKKPDMEQSMKIILEEEDERYEKNELETISQSRWLEISKEWKKDRA